MHFCPDCGEECDCSADIELLDEDCEHACEIYTDKDYDDYHIDDNYEEDPFDDLDYYDQDPDWNKGISCNPVGN